MIRSIPIKVIFLDFDGVLVTKRSWYGKSDHTAIAWPPCVTVLNEIIKLSAAKIVVSSSWRIGTPLDGLQTILSGWGVQGEVIDKTPQGASRSASGIWLSPTRGQEIADWLNSYRRTRGEVTEFVILDDDSDMKPYMDRLVQTTFDDGLTAASIPPALRLLDVTPVSSPEVRHGRPVVRR